MDPFFHQELQDDLLWFVPSPQPHQSRSSFVRYTRPMEGSRSDANYSNSISIPRDGTSMHKRMIELLRAIPTENRELENDRGHRHKMNERLRREKQRKSYSALRSMLPSQTKNDQHSILQMTAVHLQELKNEAEELKRRNHELKAALARNDEDNKIRIRVENPSSAIDSMVGMLKHLKGMNLQAKTIRSKVSAKELSAVVEVQPQVDASEVEKALQKALIDEG